MTCLKIITQRAIPQMYLVLLPILRPPSTPPWPATIVFVLLWALSIVSICLAVYVRASTGHLPAWAGTARIVAESGNIAVTTCLLIVIGGLRLAAPETLARIVSSFKRSRQADHLSRLHRTTSSLSLPGYLSPGSTHSSSSVIHRS